jgi:hypothetical protein
LKAGGKGISARNSKPPPQPAGVALEKIEHVGIERKDICDEACKAAKMSSKKRSWE